MSNDVYDGSWRLFSHDPLTGKKVWHLDMGEQIIVRTEKPVDELFAQNAEDMSNSIGKRFGDGQRVASIPMDIFFDHLNEANKNGDQAYIKKWLNDADHQKFRTFRGAL